MTTLTRFLAPVLAVSALLVATDLYAQSGRGEGRGGSGSRGDGHRGDGHRGGRHDGQHHGGRHHGHHSGHRHHHHRHRHHWHGYWGSYWWPSYSLAFGWPYAYYWGAAWDWPRYDYYYAPRETVIYREVPVYREPALLPPSTEVAPGSAPSRGPTYMNYCESAKAYFPKVTSCPEGWRLAAPGG